MRADARADQVVGRPHVRDPVADRLARRLLQRARAEVDRTHLGAEQAHSLDVGTLAPHVLLAHVDDALETEARADGRRRDAVLAGSRLGHDARLAETAREHGLPERVVELVRPGVQEVFALQIEARARQEALGERQRRRPPRVLPSERVELRCEGRVGRCLVPAGLQLVERRDERLRDESPAVLAELAVACRLSSFRAASTNARTRSWSLIPGADSRLELASTAHGRTAVDRLGDVLRAQVRPRASAAPLQPARDRGEWDRRRPTAGRSPSRREHRPAAAPRRDRGLCPPRARRAGRGRRRRPPPLRRAQRPRARCRRRRAPPRPPAGSPA